ncbi:hypothetical protein GCM10017784_32090 [Deinococcus indicus]|nr:hypothetical protein GCM10017784_32090 [Deinococcus indicus]
MLGAVQPFRLDAPQGASGHDAGAHADNHLLLEFMQPQSFVGREDGQDYLIHDRPSL